MRTYIGFEIERNEYSGNIDWISPKMIIKHLSDSDLQTTIKGKRKITSVTNEVYDNALLSYNKTYDKIVDPFNFLFIPREEFNVLSKSFYDKCYQYWKMENVKKLCRNYDKIVSALDQNPVISKSEFLEINLKKMIKVKREGLATWSENAKKEYSEFYRKIQKQLKELENELLNIKIWQKNLDTERDKKQVKFMKK